MPADQVLVNRAPVLTLWSAVVAERLGYDRDEALSLGKAVAGLSAQRKGRVLGIYKRRPPAAGDGARSKRGEEFWIDLCDCPVPAKETADGIRAVTGDKILEPAEAAQYLKSKFGESLGEVRKAMTALARRYDPDDLAAVAFSLYTQFRPTIPPGQKGWGAKGILDLARIRALGA